MKRIVIDPRFGIAGDMLSAALLALGAGREVMLGAMESAGRAIGGASVSVSEVTRLGTKGMVLRIELSGREPEVDASEIYTRLEEELVRLEIRDGYYDFALRALDILSHAEFEAHSIHRRASPVSHEEEMHGVHLHEARDIIIDLVGAAVGLQALGVDIENTTCLSPVMVGGGKVRFSHGETDVPAPATASIIKAYDFPVLRGPVDRELFTPTGAAILASLNPQFERREDFAGFGGKPVSEGIGFGTLDLVASHGMVNALFVYAQDETA
jgi:uncharacterized protein (DUF111 family)